MGAEDDADDKAHAEWVVRVFGTEEAYRRSLPAQVWEKGDGGWFSRERK